MQAKRLLSQLFLRKEDRQKIQEAARKQEIAIPFDENYFEFKVESQPIQTALIKVQAIIVKGEKQGEKLNMKCRWYNKTQSDMTEIPDVNGCFYQPSVDDVNTIISVQADPFLQGKTYEGITIMKDIGPLKLDPKVESLSQKAVKNQRLELQGKIQTIFSQDDKYSKIECPHEIMIITRPDELKVISRQSKSQIAVVKIEKSQPSIDIIKKTPSSFLLNTENQCFRISLDDNISRDVFTLTVRTFCSRKLVLQAVPAEAKEQTQKSQAASPPMAAVSSPASQSNLQFVLKIDEITRSLSKSRQNYAKLEQDYESIRTHHSKLLQQSEIMKKQLTRLQQVSQEHAVQKQQLLKLKQQNNYYMNEIGIYKKELKDKDQTIEKLNQMMKDKEKQEDKWKQHEKQALSGSIQEIEQLKNEINEMKRKIEELEQQRDEQNSNMERMQDQNHRLLKKCEGLVDETGKKQHDLAYLKMKQLVDEKQGEIQALKGHMFKLEHLYSKSQAEKKQELKSWDLKQIVNGLKGSKNQEAAMGYLQKLVNNLTETVSEKEIELESQKFINKQLIRKVRDLEIALTKQTNQPS